MAVSEKVVVTPSSPIYLAICNADVRGHGEITSTDDWQEARNAAIGHTRETGHETFYEVRRWTRFNLE